MKIIYNNLIPFKGFAAINLFGILFVRKGIKVSEGMINHEAIHTAQMKEMLYIFFYLWYIIEWIVKLFKWGKNSYYHISFEEEAYMDEHDLDYLKNRDKYSWIEYL